MKKKFYISRAIKLICLMVAVTLTVALLQNFILKRHDHNSIRIDGYYIEDKDSLDVVMLGASELYSGFSSAYAYEKHGFTSYPFSTESVTASSMTTSLKEILRTQNPKLLIVEINPYIYGKPKNETDEGHIRKLIDNIPMNQNKIDFIEKNITENKLEYYLPIIKYHGIWNEYPSVGKKLYVTVKQDLRGYSYLRGYRTKTEQFKPWVPVLNDKIKGTTETAELNPQLESELRAFLDLCKKEKLENILFIRCPHMVIKDTYTRTKRANKAGEIIKSYGYDFLNMETSFDKLGIDVKTDFYNYEHLNIYGSVKLTDYLSDYIAEKYGLKPSSLSDKQSAEWKTSVQYFEKLRKYCDDMFKKKEVTFAGEDMKTLQALEKY